MDDPKNLPKITRQMLNRTLIGAAVLLSLAVAYQWWQGQSSDPGGLRRADTKDMIAALQLEDEGQRAVVFRPDGTKVEVPGYREGATDRDLVWSPDGNFLYFISDREDNIFHVYRWSPAGGNPEKRTTGTAGRSNLFFPPESWENSNLEALMTSGGKVLSFLPRDATTQQKLPPVGREVAKGAGENSAGMGSQFDSVYEKIGSSFREAIWLKDKRFIAAIMLRDQGDVLVVQDLLPPDEASALPKPIAAGNRIKIDLDPKTGNLVFVVQGFQAVDKVPAEWIQNGKVIKPFEHLVGLFDPEAGRAEPIAQTPSNDLAFDNPKVSPDGSSVMVTIGKYDPASGSIEPRGLVVMPNRANGGTAGSGIVEGPVLGASWHPSGERIVYVRKEGGKRALFTAGKDGSSPRNLSGVAGDFDRPLFSPRI